MWVGSLGATSTGLIGLSGAQTYRIDPLTGDAVELTGAPVLSGYGAGVIDDELFVVKPVADEKE